jgi:hypothetical protein
MSEWANGFLVKRALREWLGGLVAPLFGSPESLEAAEFMKQHGEHHHALQALRDAGFELPKDVSGITYQQTGPDKVRTALLSGSAKPEHSRSAVTDLAWHQTPDAARAQLSRMGGSSHLPAFSLGGRKAFAEASARGSEMSGRLKSLGTKTLLGAGGGALGAYLLYKALSKNKEEPTE